MIKCKNCGADMRFDIDKQLLVCDYCDSTEDVVNIHRTDISSEEQVMEAIVHTCPMCGAELYTTEDTAATFCSYCGQSVLLESRMVMVGKPDYIIPFKITKEEAEKAYRKKLSGAIFAPSEIKKAEIESMRGIYMPYWEYYIQDDSHVNFSTFLNEHREGDYLVSDQYRVTFRNQIVSDGLEYDASSKFPDELSQSCAPFYFKESKLFNTGYMSGFYADLGDVPPETYELDAANIVKEVAAEEILENSDLPNYNVTESNLEKRLNIGRIVPGLAMYPVWFACARDKKNKYINYAAINGQTGKVAADLPLDKKKIILWTLIFAVPIFLLLYLLFTPNPITTVVIIGILSIAGTLIGLRKVDGTTRPDKGMGITQRDADNADKKLKKAEKSKMRIRLIIGLAVIVLVIFFQPVSDIYYYAAAIISGVLCGWTYWRVFELHNRSIERPLPQLEKRGGEGA